MDLIKSNIDDVEKLFDAHNVDKMYLFGSVLEPKFTPKSDIDFLVKFKSIDLAKYFDNYINLKESLEHLLSK